MKDCRHRISIKYRSKGGVNIGRNKWLLREINIWQEDELISQEQAELLRERYPSKEMPLSVLLPVLGSILLGVGIILFFAANWPVLPVTAKLLLIFGVFGLCQHYAYVCRYQRSQVWLGSSLLLLGGILFGSAIFLIAQIYNINAYYPNGILFWSVGVFLMAWVSREKPLTILAVVLAMMWTVTDAGESAPIVPWLHLLVLFLLAFPAAYRAQSVIAVFLSQVLMLIIMLISIPDHIQQIMPAYMVWLGSALLLKGQQGTDPFNYLYIFSGLLVALSTLLITTFNPMHITPVISPALLVKIAALAAFFLILWLLPGFRHLRRELTVIAGINLLFVIYLAAIPAVHLFLYFIILLAVILLIVQGANQQQALQLNIGLIFFYLTVIRGYFDYAAQYMDRSLFFILGGILLLTIGWWLNRQREKILSAWRESA